MARNTLTTEKGKMHVSSKLAKAEKAKKPIFSFEFFPPKTAQVFKQFRRFLSECGTDGACRVCRTSMTVRPPGLKLLLPTIGLHADTF